MGLLRITIKSTAVGLLLLFCPLPELSYLNPMARAAVPTTSSTTQPTQGSEARSAFSYYVTGHVRRSGVFEAKHAMTLKDAIKRAGIEPGRWYVHTARMSGNGKGTISYEVWLQEVMKPGSPKNEEVLPEDEIYVTENPFPRTPAILRRVHITGDAPTTGDIKLENETSLTARRAALEVAGVQESEAALWNIVIQEKTADGGHLRIDRALKDIISGELSDVSLQPDDVVEIRKLPTTREAEVKSDPKAPQTNDHHH